MAINTFLILSDYSCRYEPGDVAVIHPEAMPADVESFLACIGFVNTADDPIEIEHILEGAHT